MNIVKLVNKFLVLLSPWVILVGLFRHNFQEFYNYNGLLLGPEFHDFYTLTEGFMLALIVFNVVGFISGAVKLDLKKVKLEIWIVVGLLLIAGVMQLFFQTVYEPILSTPIYDFRRLILLPLLFFIIILLTFNEKDIKWLIKSYVGMISVFSALTLYQYVTAAFPGDIVDFTGRLVWPFIDWLTLKITSANWIAFFATPAFLISCFEVINLFMKKKKLRLELYFFLTCVILSGAVIYLTQSYGAYGAIFASISLYLFRVLKFKKFAIAFLVLILIGGGIFLLQKNSAKFKIMQGSKITQFDNSVSSRSDIYKMNFNIIKKHPIIGVGFNQYQSYFANNYQEILQKEEYKELNFPPHAHNFFMSFWTNLGIFGFAGMLILVIGIFARFRLNPQSPFVFVFIAVLIHGIIDSYYWKQEITYIFWLVIAFIYLYKPKLFLKRKIK